MSDIQKPLNHSSELSDPGGRLLEALEMMFDIIRLVCESIDSSKPLGSTAIIECRSNRSKRSSAHWRELSIKPELKVQLITSVKLKQRAKNHALKLLPTNSSLHSQPSANKYLESQSQSKRRVRNVMPYLWRLKRSWWTTSQRHCGMGFPTQNIVPENVHQSSSRTSAKNLMRH